MRHSHWFQWQNDDARWQLRICLSGTTNRWTRQPLQAQSACRWRNARPCPDVTDYISDSGYYCSEFQTEYKTRIFADLNGVKMAQISYQLRDYRYYMQLAVIFLFPTFLWHFIRFRQDILSWYTIITMVGIGVWTIELWSLNQKKNIQKENRNKTLFYKIT